ncbi:MAG: lysophospholipid acyltransferase family protein [Ruminiclostridium sp.]|nr:lysophospholipid acyltransferase family protein [Ruminiclostridium sp.]
MAPIRYSYSKWFNKFLKATLGAYLLMRFNVKLYNDKIKDLKPPYLVIGNHVGAWDPLLMSMGIKEPVYFVISDSLFRNFWLRQVFKLVGGISKTKKIVDSSTIRAIISIKNANGVIGLYPEGARNWDLKSLPIFPATAKLIKNLKIPVVSTLMEGAGFTRPRWGRSSRTGIINLRFNLLLTPEEINNMSVDEINASIVESIHFNEYDWQEKNMIRFKGNNRAEFLDLFLVVCPKCRSLCTMQSHKHSFTCTECGYSVEYDEYGYLNTKAEPFFNSTQSWSVWQDSYLYELFSKDEYISGQKALFSDTRTRLFTGKRRGRLRQYNWLGKVELFFDKVVFTPEKGMAYSFPLDKLTGMNIQNNNKFEFYYEDNLYRFRFTTQHKSVYKYYLAAMIVNKIKAEKENIKQQFD